MGDIQSNVTVMKGLSDITVYFPAVLPGVIETLGCMYKARR
jgi:hypothetical protein